MKSPSCVDRKCFEISKKWLRRERLDPVAGMGIHVLRNFTAGGEWILQDALTNGPAIARILPPAAPLSTLRIVTGSRHWLRRRLQVAAESGIAAASERLPAAESSFAVLTAVLRAGRAGASTDHNCICFPVDARTGELHAGKSNQHWYKLGMRNCLRVGETFGKTWNKHPDAAAASDGVAGERATLLIYIPASRSWAHRSTHTRHARHMQALHAGASAPSARRPARGLGRCAHGRARPGNPRAQHLLQLLPRQNQRRGLL